MFTTFFLKFENEAQAITALANYRNDDQWVVSSQDYALDVVGVIYKPTGVMIENENGIKYPEMTPVEGWHVNLACEVLPAELEQYKTTPSTPYRVFAS